MYTYTMQNIKPSGEAFAIEWDGNTIHATCGPLSRHDRNVAIRNPESLPDWEYSTEDFIDEDEWGFPVVTYDPNTGEVYRDEHDTEVIETLSQREDA